ncbi:unnamed protein product [Camellia sinensis]
MDVVRGTSEDYILNFLIYFVIGFCYEFASLKVFFRIHCDMFEVLDNKRFVIMLWI